MSNIKNFRYPCEQPTFFFRLHLKLLANCSLRNFGYNWEKKMVVTEVFFNVLPHGITERPRLMLILGLGKNRVT